MTSSVVSPRKKTDGDGRQLSPEQAAAAAMVAEAKARGLELTGPNGLLKLFTKHVLETALNEELSEHLGHKKNRAEPGRGLEVHGAISRSGGGEVHRAAVPHPVDPADIINP